MGPTESQIPTVTKLKRIAWLSSRDPQKVFNNLMHLFNVESLRTCFNESYVARQHMMRNGLERHFLNDSPNMGYGLMRIKPSLYHSQNTQPGKEPNRSHSTSWVLHSIGPLKKRARNSKGKTCGKRHRAKLKKVKEWAISVKNRFKLKDIGDGRCNFQKVPTVLL